MRLLDFMDKKNMQIFLKRNGSFPNYTQITFGNNWGFEFSKVLTTLGTPHIHGQSILISSSRRHHPNRISSLFLQSTHTRHTMLTPCTHTRTLRPHTWLDFIIGTSDLTEYSYAFFHWTCTHMCILKIGRHDRQVWNLNHSGLGAHLHI